MMSPTRVSEATYSAPFQLCMFLLAGVGGYLYMGNEVDGMLMPDSSIRCEAVEVIEVLEVFSFKGGRIAPR